MISDFLDDVEFISPRFVVSSPAGLYDSDSSLYDGCVYDAPLSDPGPVAVGVYDDVSCLYDGCSFDIVEGTFPIVVGIYDQVDVLYDWCVYDSISVVPPVSEGPAWGRWLVWDGSTWVNADYMFQVYTGAVPNFQFIPSMYAWYPQSLTSSTEVAVSSPRSYTGTGVLRGAAPDTLDAVYDVSHYDESVYVSGTVPGGDAVYDNSYYDQSVYAVPPPLPGVVKVALYDDTNSTYDVSLYGSPATVPGVVKIGLYDDPESQYNIALYGSVVPPVPGVVNICIYDDPESQYDTDVYGT